MTGDQTSQEAAPDSSNQYRRRIVLRPIGRAVASRRSGRMEIDLDPAFLKGLAGINSGDHLWVLYWMHELPRGERRRLQVHPRGDRRRPKRGVFALHSPCRPNPIGMTRVRVLKVEESTLVVDGLDAHDGSPILDIKSG